MTPFWSFFVAAIGAVNLLGCVWLLWWTAKRPPGEPETTGHVWDGDISEYNKPLPRWWINLFYLTIVFTVAYLAWYPGFGAMAGVGQWTSKKQHDSELAKIESRLALRFKVFENQSLADLMGNADALGIGQSVFAHNCSTCHGSDARGSKGYPNLTDTIWHWGGEPDTVLKTVLEGRQAAMPALAMVLGSDQAVTETAVYVQSLSGQAADPILVAAGKARFAGVCAACHGPQGKGNPLLGAPDLTDGYWLYGREIEAIRTAIVSGRNGQMPAHAEIIGAARARLVAAYVLSLSAPPAAK
jgi:cytochrome c oxidase cbb3-type subunit 3